METTHLRPVFAKASNKPQSYNVNSTMCVVMLVEKTAEKREYYRRLVCVQRRREIRGYRFGQTRVR